MNDDDCYWVAMLKGWWCVYHVSMEKPLKCYEKKRQATAFMNKERTKLLPQFLKNPTLRSKWEELLKAHKTATIDGEEVAITSKDFSIDEQGNLYYKEDRVDLTAPKPEKKPRKKVTND